MRAEISYDLVMQDDMGFVEGAYRLPESSWQVVIFMRKEVNELCWQQSEWDNGVTGLVVRYPRSRPLNKRAVEAVLSEALGVTEWVEVRGPDSLALR